MSSGPYGLYCSSKIPEISSTLVMEHQSGGLQAHRVREKCESVSGHDNTHVTHLIPSRPFGKGRLKADLSCQKLDV